MLRRIAIVGNGGGGKSTAARKLSIGLGIPLFSVDQVQFEPGWVRADASKVSAWHEGASKRDRWIIDGWGGWDLIESRFNLADAIFFIDLPLSEHLAGARTREAMEVCEDAPPGCDYRDVRHLMTETLERVDRDLMPPLRRMVESHQGQRIVEVARTVDDREAILGRWLSQAP